MAQSKNVIALFCSFPNSGPPSDVSQIDHHSSSLVPLHAEGVHLHIADVNDAVIRFMFACFIARQITRRLLGN